MVRNKKRILMFGIIGVLALVALVGVYAYKNIQEKPPVTVEQSTKPDASPTNNSSKETEIPVTTLTGTFKGVDVVHSGSGTLKITETDGRATLTFGDDFTVTQGPDLFVYLSPNAPGEDLGEYASLGNLKAQEGVQVYDLPSNYKEYKTVIIWCRAFGVTFATAELIEG